MGSLLKWDMKTSQWVLMCVHTCTYNKDLMYLTLFTFTFSGTNGASTVQLTVKDTETVVTGLTPGADYNFSVTAENAVSSQDMNINDRTVNINATTEVQS